MPDVLLPRLTALDRRVLNRLPANDQPGKRLFDTFKAPDPGSCLMHFHRYGAGDDEGCKWCAYALDVIADAYEEHCEILRGLEAVGLAANRGGWWRRAPA